MGRVIAGAMFLVLAACGSEPAEIKTPERMEKVENDCGLLSSKAALNTGGVASTNFCYCMVQVLGEKPDIHVDAISRTLTVVADEHSQSGASFAEIATGLHAAAKEPNADDRSKALGIGIGLVEELSMQVGERAKGGRC